MFVNINVKFVQFVHCLNIFCDVEFRHYLPISLYEIKLILNDL